MSEYVRPVWDQPMFRDADGAAFEYGSRWGMGGPPVDTYSIDTHPERFAPLHLVADALIEHLAETFAVQVSHEPANAQDFIHPPEFLRVTRVTPADPAAAPLTFGFAAYPAVFLHAGLLHDFIYPACGCDACDETAVGQAELLERHVLAVAAGRYGEACTPGGKPPLMFWFSWVDGGQSGGSPGDHYPAGRLAAAERRFRELPGGWTSWPLE